MKLYDIISFDHYTIKSKIIILTIIGIFIFVLILIQDNYIKEKDYNIELWAARTAEINDLIIKNLSEIYSKIEIWPVEYPLFDRVTYVDIAFSFISGSTDKHATTKIKNTKTITTGGDSKTLKIEFVWSKQDAVKLSNSQNIELQQYHHKIQMAEGIMNIMIDSKCVQLNYQGFPSWHNKITINPPDTIRSLLQKKCQEGQTYAWPKSIIPDYYKWDNNPDTNLNYENLPGIKYPDYDMTNYGRCVNGSIIQFKCPSEMVYVGCGKCVYCTPDVYNCLINMHTGSGIYTIPLSNEQSSYYDCIQKPPYTKKITCAPFSFYKESKCTPVVHNICENTFTDKALPSLFINEPGYENSFVNCAQPQNPTLIKCGEIGLNKNKTKCDDGLDYVYNSSVDSFTLKPFLIECQQIDKKTKECKRKTRAKLITRREYVYKSINRSDSTKYDRNMDVYIEYEIPEFYFTNGDMKICKSFRDCMELFKKSKIRVQCPILNNKMQFYNLSVFIDFFKNSGAIGSTDLILSYGVPEILTANEHKQISEMAIVYAGTLVDKSRVYVCDNHSDFKICEDYAVLSVPPNAYWCNARSDNVIQTSHPEMTSDPNKFYVKDVITKNLSNDNIFGYFGLSNPVHDL